MFRDTFSFPDSAPVNAAILAYPVITTKEGIIHKNSFRYLLGHDPNETEKEKFSCENMVSEKTPPTFLWHTASDENVSVENSLVYAEALSHYGVPFELHIYPYGCHGLSTVDEQTNDKLDFNTLHSHEWLSAVKKWLRLTFQ